VEGAKGKRMLFLEHRTLVERRRKIDAAVEAAFRTDAEQQLGRPFGEKLADGSSQKIARYED
jgi:hypothetical protein